MHAGCSWSQVSTFQHYRNLPLASSLSQSLYSSHQALPPTFDSNPSSPPPTQYTRLPSHPFPPSSWPGPPGPFQQHSLSTTPSILAPRPPPTLVPSFTVSPVPFPSVIHPPDQCRPRTPHPIRPLHSPFPSTNPPNPHYQTHTTPPTLTHWWFSTCEAVIPLMDLRPSFTNPSILIYQPLTKHTLRTYCNAGHEDTLYLPLNSATI